MGSTLWHGLNCGIDSTYIMGCVAGRPRPSHEQAPRGVTNMIGTGAGAKMGQDRVSALLRICRAGVVALIMCFSGAVPVAATESEADCLSDDNERRVTGCSELIDGGELSGQQLSLAYSMRALAYSLTGLYDQALRDYDEAIRLNPSFAVALNNRAWTYFKSGKPGRGVGDVERSLELSPDSPHTIDTRAHIRQALGRIADALADYEYAMRLGGQRMIRLYQCGLQSQGLYTGEIDGLYSVPLRRAFEACVARRDCDPLPPDEECRNVTS